MSDASTDTLRATLIQHLRDAYLADRGVPKALEGDVRAYARALRLQGTAIEKAIIDVKSIVRAEADIHEPVFIPSVVGWTVAGYFASTPGRNPAERE